MKISKKLSLKGWNYSASIPSFVTGVRTGAPSDDFMNINLLKLIFAAVMWLITAITSGLLAAYRVPGFSNFPL